MTIAQCGKVPRQVYNTAIPRHNHLNSLDVLIGLVTDLETYPYIEQAPEPLQKFVGKFALCACTGVGAWTHHCDQLLITQILSHGFARAITIYQLTYTWKHHAIDIYTIETQQKTGFVDDDADVTMQAEAAPSRKRAADSDSDSLDKRLRRKHKDCSKRDRDSGQAALAKCLADDESLQFGRVRIAGPKRQKRPGKSRSRGNKATPRGAAAGRDNSAPVAEDGVQDLHVDRQVEELLEVPRGSLRYVCIWQG